MKINSKISLLLGCMIIVVLAILTLVMVISSARFREYGATMAADISGNVRQNVERQLTSLADEIGNYVVSIEDEIDKNMLTAARYLAAMDRARGYNLSQAELERIKADTGMNDLYVGGRDGVFTLSTEPASIGMSLFSIWDGYRMLVTGESDYLPSTLKRKEETGEVFKFTAIPRHDGRGVLESALNADSIEGYLQKYITSNNGILSMNLFDYTFLTLTQNKDPSAKAEFEKGAIAKSDKIAALFKDPKNISMTINEKDANIFFPVMAAGPDGKPAIRYVLFIHLDTTGYFAVKDIIDKPLEALIAENQRMNIMSGAAVIISLVFFTLFTGFFTGKLLSPLGYFDKLLAAFASGDFTLAVSQDLKKRQDEVGDMSRSFDAAISEMRSLITVIKEQSESLKHTGTELVTNMASASESISKITGHIRFIKEQIDTQAGGVAETGSSMEQSMSLVGNLNDNVTVQFDRVKESFESVTEMRASINSIVETLAKNAEEISKLAQTADTSKSDLQTVVQDIQEIAMESEGLLEINSVIDNIASQTNLLSMNAAIEAAHAGESGKGFAVVADEIRKLAESSSEQSKTTAAMLKKIKASIDEITKSTDIVLRRFESIDEEVHIVSTQEQSIRSSVEEQEQGSGHILDAMTEIRNISGEVQRKSGEIAGKSRSALSQIASLKQATDEIENRMKEIASSAEQIESTVARINDISGKNKENIDTLSAKMEKFKI